MLSVAKRPRVSQVAQQAREKQEQRRGKGNRFQRFKLQKQKTGGGEMDGRNHL